MSGIKLVLYSCALAVGLVASEGLASFHEMQIEQVIAGVNGDTNAQAIQLRMRGPFEYLLGGNARMRAYDANGGNPITLIDFNHNVNPGTGGRILITSAGMSAYESSSITSDFTLANLIPASYLAAGRLTFERTIPDGTVLWSIAWGGSGYTGSTTGEVGTNDADGDFGKLAGTLPSSGLQALLFDGTATDFSTNNQADYIVTPGAAVFTNNAGASFTVVPEPASAVMALGGVALLSGLRRRR